MRDRNRTLYQEKRLDEFLDNHWPHMESRMGRLAGMVHVLVALGGVTIAGIITMLVKAW